ncbi:nitrogen fixation protein NifZ [Aurantivibrio plasticivorans]
MNHLRSVQKGDAVFATTTIVNDGSVPGVDDDVVFATPGTMGMLINTGYVEEEPQTELYLVSFRDEHGQAGPPVTCLADEISASPVS